MEFADDDDIQSLLDMGEYVIDSIKHAQTAGQGTAGRSAIPKGIVKSTTEAWEQDAETQAQDSPFTPTSQGIQASESNLTTLDNDSSDNPPASVQEQAGQNRDALSGLFTSLDMMEQKQIKKGGGATKPKDRAEHLILQPPVGNAIQVPHPLQKLGGEKRTQPQLLEHQNNSRQLMSPGSPIQEPNQSGNLGIDGNTLSAGIQQKTPSLLHPGVTQLVPLLGLSQQSSDVGVGTAPVTAQDVNQIMTTLMQQQTVLQSLTQSINKICETLAILPVLRNDLQVVKSSCALLEAQLASIRILDPGHAGISSLNELRNSGQQAIVVTHGSTPGKDSSIYQQPIVLDELARPVGKDYAVTPQPSRTIDIADIESMKALITTYVKNERRAAKYINQLAKVTNVDQLLRLKQQILNS
uniref:Phosphoprotein n=1 Tax=Avian metaavulavirus 21 TaxID=2613793 RepID=A0A5J6CUV0_9MONO|nr:phosphoprotein [Avian metaavulavirus 21]